METSDKESHEQLVERLTTGFGALLEQVQELARRNTNLEQRLAHVREEVMTRFSSALESFPMTIHYSSRSGATRVAVIDNIHIL